MLSLVQKESEEKLYQDALINALGEFADHLPDFQKIDIMMFIVSKIPSGQRAGKTAKPDLMLHSILLKSLLKVTNTCLYKDVLIIGFKINKTTQVSIDSVNAT